MTLREVFLLLLLFLTPVNSRHTSRLTLHCPPALPGQGWASRPHTELLLWSLRHDWAVGAIWAKTTRAHERDHSSLQPSAAELQLSEELGFLVLILWTWHSDTHGFSLTAPRFTSTHSAAALPVSGNLSSTIDDAQLDLLTSSKRMKLNALSEQKHHTH